MILQKSHRPFVSPLALFFGGQGPVCAGEEEKSKEHDSVAPGLGHHAGDKQIQCSSEHC